MLEKLSSSPSKAEEAELIRKKYGLDTDEPKNIKFFLRSESVRAREEVEKSNEQFFETASSPGPTVNPLQEAFPLAKQPHLLQPYARKEHLFSSPHPTLDSAEARTNEGPATGENSEAESMEEEHSEQAILSYAHLNKR